MVYKNRVQPILDSANTSEAICIASSQNSRSSSKEVNDLDSLSTVGLEESSYLKLRPFSRLDPTLVRLLRFLSCFGLTVNFESKETNSNRSWSETKNKSSMYMKIAFMALIGVISGEVVYDVNLRQSKLLAEQKRSTPLLTFVIVAYSWLTLVIPVICDFSLVFTGSHLFRFYSRTTATVCNGKY